MLIDLILVALIALGGYAGYKKGLIGILVSFVALILSIVFAFMLQAPLADYLANETSVGSTLQETIQTNLQKSQEENQQEEQQENNTVYDTLLQAITGKSAQEYTIEQSSKLMTDFILKGLSFVAIFLLVFIICYILQMVLNLVFDLPILSSVNKLGGIALGGFKVLIKIGIIFTILYFLSPIPLFNGITSMMEHTTIANFIYQNNIFVAIIQSTLKI